MASEEALFCSYDLEDVLRAQQEKMIREIDGLSVAALNEQTAADTSSQMARKYAVSVPILDRQRITVDKSEIKIDVSDDPRRAIFRGSGPVYVKGVKLVFHVPFQGDPELLRCRPNVFSLNPPLAAVAARELLVSYSGPAPNPEVVKEELQRTLNQIEVYLKRIADSASAFNASLPGVASSRLKHRVNELQKEDDLLRQLGYPLRGNGGATGGAADEARRPHAPRAKDHKAPALSYDVALRAFLWVPTRGAPSRGTLLPPSA
ncbi:MAG: hypothetical protein FJ290_30250 [Planctomycetes bacterium]|nr:hypothetical protein [Planctomycetota bacterium]